MPPLRSHTHLQATQAGTQIQSLQKSMPALTHGQKDIAAKMKENVTRKINNETLIKAICNKGFRGNSSILPRIKFRVGGQIIVRKSILYIH